MSDTSFTNNPFAQLDKNLFDKKKGAQKDAQKATPKAPPKPTKPKAEQKALDEDAALFFDAMRATSPLSKDKGRKKQKSKPLHNPVFLDNVNAEPERQKSVAEGDLHKKEIEPKTVTAPPTTQANTKPFAAQSAETEPTDVSFFASAMQGVAPLDGRGRKVMLEPVAKKAAPQKILTPDLQFAVNSSREYVEGYLLGLDLMLVGQLQAGQYKPAAHLDLHGFLIRDAFYALVQAIRIAYMKDQRTILVVTGRGHHSHAGQSLLRDKVQEWLTQEPVKHVVLAFCSAKPSDGGVGALYVLLRRLRKTNASIDWEKTPPDPDIL